MTELPIQIDDLSLKKLVLIRQLYQQGVLHSGRRHSIVNRIMAIITFDLAAETILKAVFSTLAPHRTPSGSFEAIIQQIEHIVNRPLPSRAQILRVHKIRNTAQHEARYPNEDDLDECRVYTRDFLDELTQLMWGVSIDTVSMTDLVANAVAKGFLVEAEKSLRQHDWEQAVKDANAGLTWALRRARGKFVNEPYVMTPVRSSINSKKFYARFNNRRSINQFGESDPEIKDVIQSVYETTLDDIGTVLNELESMTRAIETDMLRAQYAIVEFTLGINRADYLRFRHIAGNVEFTDAEARELNFRGLKSDIGRDEAEFVFDFCVTSVLQIEAQVGDIERPFGID